MESILLKSDLSLILNKSKKSTLANWMRFCIIPLLALILTHFVSYGKLPYDNSYEFPTLTFLIVLTYGSVICEVTRFFYYQSLEKNSLNDGILSFIKKSYFLTIGTTTITYTLLFFLDNIIFPSTPSVQGYLSYLMILIGISSLGTGAYLFRDINNFIKSKNKPVLDRIYLLKAGISELKVMEKDISFFEWRNGLAVMVTKNGDSVTTNYLSLNEVERLLNTNKFFRISRRFLVSPEAVTSFKKEEKGKLKVNLTCNGKDITVFVSRHKNKNFREWLKANAS